MDRERFGENEETTAYTKRAAHRARCCSLSVRSDSSSIGVSDLECVGVNVPADRGSNSFLIIRFFNEIFGGGRDSDSDPDPVEFRGKPVLGFSGLVTFQLLSST